MNRLISRSLITVFALLVLFCVPSIASADGLTWTLMNVTFGDWTNSLGATIGSGGSASGTFFYNAIPSPTGAYGPLMSISTTPWAPTTLSTSYTSLTPFANSNNSGLGVCSPPTCGTATDFTDTAFLFLVFNNPSSTVFNHPLTNAGGTIPISTIPGDSMELFCLDSGCDSFDARSVTGGKVFAAVATPEPSTFLLFGSGLLALLVWSAIRKVVSA
jgi:hypothetical protein